MQHFTMRGRAHFGRGANKRELCGRFLGAEPHHVRRDIGDLHIFVARLERVEELVIHRARLERAGDVGATTGGEITNGV